MTCKVSLEALTFAYPNHSALFTEFDWSVEQGTSWAVLGASGCGKTTLLYLLDGLLQPASGFVKVDGQSLQRPRPQTGLILQDFGLLPWETVRENIRLGLKIRSLYGPDGKHSPVLIPPAVSVDSWLERLGLTAVANSYPAHLSGGQRQRTAIARTLILQPDLLLMDEPFSSLDTVIREDLQKLTRQLWVEQHFTFILVTHSIEEAASLGQKILILGNPPHHRYQVVDNPGLMQPDASHSAQYMAICQSLRHLMEPSLPDEKA